MLAFVTLAALISIVCVQNHRAAEKITALESELQSREVELAKHALIFRSYASVPPTEYSNEDPIARSLFLFLKDGELLIKHKNKVAETANMFRGFDPNPAVRARQLAAEIEVNAEFVADCVDGLIDRANAETLEYVMIAIQSDSKFEFDKSDQSAKRQRFDKIIKKLQDAIKKTSNQSRIAG